MPTNDPCIHTRQAYNWGWVAIWQECPSRLDSRMIYAHEETEEEALSRLKEKLDAEHIQSTA